MKRYPGQMNLDVTPRETAIRALSRAAAAEGMVLMENNGALPLREGEKLALFGQGVRYTIKGGTGSGDVNGRNTVNVEEGLKGAGFQIVNTEWLDRYDVMYQKGYETWRDSVYQAAGEERDPNRFYIAHAGTHPEIPELYIQREDLAGADKVIYVISRVSGEFADRHAEPGDYYLSGREEADLEALGTSGKPLIVVLNVGGIIDLSFLDRVPVAALVLMSQAGSEGGNALADVLSGKVCPSGRLTDTYARRYEDYPSSATFSHRDGNLLEERYLEGIYVGYRYFDTFGVAPRYPFGYGLSYTRFSTETVSAAAKEDGVRVSLRVRNEGKTPGKQVVQLYAACPSGVLTTERKRLVAFGKTKLLAPGEEETLTLDVRVDQLAVYHEGKSAWVLQEGNYGLLAGENAEDWQPVLLLKADRTVALEQLTPICELMEVLKELRPEQADEDLDGLSFPLGAVDITAAAEKYAAECHRPAAPQKDVIRKRAEEIAGSMSAREKACLVVGARSAMAGEIVGSQAQTVPGAAGETVAFAEHGIPGMVLADGPAGIRVTLEYDIDPKSGEIYQPKDRFELLENRFFGRKVEHEGAEKRYQIATAIPIGTLLAQSFDTALVERVGEAMAEEMKAFGVAVWLAPGMNIHRNPLCGRNFEYYSEDPLLSGRMAAAMTRGVQKTPGLGVSIKHFACNNQEDNRMHVNELIAERALREIYLKGFEIAVKEAQPVTIMTSYNRINGVHSANNRDLCTTVAREEWGFRGLIMTDWSTTNGGGSNAAKCILAGNDLVMPGTNSDIQEILDALEGKRLPRLTEEKLDESVIRIIDAALRAQETLSLPVA